MLNLVPTAKALVALFTRLEEDASGTGEAKAMLANAKMAEVENFMMNWRALKTDGKRFGRRQNWDERTSLFMNEKFGFYGHHTVCPGGWYCLERSTILQNIVAIYCSQPYPTTELGLFLNPKVESKNI